MKNAKVLGPWLVSPLLFIFLVALLFSSKPNWGIPPAPRVWKKSEIPANRAFVGVIDSPLVAQSRGYLPVSGWAAATSPGSQVVKVEIVLNGMVLAVVEDFVYRPDVGAAFGRPDFDWSGWRCVISTEKLRPGEYKLQLRATASNGNSEIVATKNLTIVE